MLNLDLFFIITVAVALSCLLGFLIGKNMTNQRIVYSNKKLSHKQRVHIGVLIDAYQKDKLRVELIGADIDKMYHRISLIEHNPGKSQLKFTDKES